MLVFSSNYVQGIKNNPRCVKVDNGVPHMTHVGGYSLCMPCVEGLDPMHDPWTLEASSRQ